MLHYFNVPLFAVALVVFTLFNAALFQYCIITILILYYYFDIVLFIISLFQCYAI